METNKVNVKIAGFAGQGIMMTGLTFSKACTRGGLHVFDYIEYPSLIKGGHNTYQIRVEEKEVKTQLRLINILIALNKETIYLHQDEMAPDGIIIYDNEVIKEVPNYRNDVKLAGVPLSRVAREAGADKLMENTVALGSTIAFLDYDLKIVEEVIKDMFKGKSVAIIKKNLDALKQGYNHTKENHMHFCTHKLTPINKTKERMVLTGNEAVAVGAIHAGCRFYSAYPMTPASSILHVLAGFSGKKDIVVKHVEDEISAINMAIGAGHMGLRSMTGTSGGGFALMGEGVSLAGITETPVVIVEAMRGGPGTGVPTWTEQADLKFILNAGHGDFPRLVVAPGDVEEAYELTKDAFNMAEKYQTPTIVLVDKYLSESHKSQDFFTTDARVDRGKLMSQEDLNNVEKGEFRRYEVTGDGISPRSVPGLKNGMFLANSDEHTPYGYSCEEIDNRNAQHEKRMRKLENARKDIPEPKIYGPKKADLTLVGFGSVKGPLRQTVDWAEKEGLKVNFLHLNWISPFPRDFVKKNLEGKKTLIVENNISGQLQDVIREQTGITFEHHYRRYDGRPIYAEDLIEKIREVL